MWVGTGRSPSGADCVLEASLGDPEGLKAETGRDRRTLVRRGEKEGDMVRANPSDGAERGEGAAEVPIWGDKDPVQDRLGRGGLTIGPGKSRTNPINLPQGEVSDEVIEHVHSGQADIAVVLVFSHTKQVEVAPYHHGEGGSRDLKM